MTPPPLHDRYRIPRCVGCGLPAELCLCASIAPLATRTTIALIAHRTEWGRSANTGRLLLRALPSTKLRLRGEATNEAPAPLVGRRLVLFPSADARPLTVADAGDDLVLVVPEGSWRQARRALEREPWSMGAERVALPEGAPSRYALRTAPREEGLATLEAVARALGVLEGEAIERALTGIFEAFVARSMALRKRG